MFGSGLQTLLYPDVYQNVMEKNGVYALALRSMNAPEGIFTVDDIRPIVNDIMGRVFAYLRSETNQLNLTISLQSGVVHNVLLAKLSALPPCQAGQVPFDVNGIACRPSGMSPEAIINSMPAMDIPSVDLTSVVNANGEIQKARDVIAAFRTAMIYAIIIAVICLGIIIFITRSVKSSARWVGANLVIVGLMGISFLLIKDAIPSVFGNQEILISLLKEIISTVADRIVFHGIVVLIIGIIALAVSF